MARIRDHAFSQTSSRSEEHTSELQSQSNLVCRLLLEKKNATALPSLLLEDDHLAGVVRVVGAADLADAQVMLQRVHDDLTRDLPYDGLWVVMLSAVRG